MPKTRLHAYRLSPNVNATWWDNFGKMTRALMAQTGISGAGEGSLGRDRLILGHDTRFACARLAGGFSLGDCAILVISRADCWRQHSEIQTGIGRFKLSVRLAVVSLKAVIAFPAIAVVAALISLAAVVSQRAAVDMLFALISAAFGIRHFFVTGFAFTLFFAPVATFAVIIPPFALRTAFFLPTAVIGEHTEIMVGKLVVIFGLYTITIELRVLRQFLVLFQHLGCVAACAIVDAVLVIVTVTIVVLRAIIAPAATAAGLPIIHKDLSVLIFSNPVSLVLPSTRPPYAAPS
jgi:hypothetical protein